MELDYTNAIQKGIICAAELTLLSGIPFDRKERCDVFDRIWDGEYYNTDVADQIREMLSHEYNRRMQRNITRYAGFCYLWLVDGYATICYNIHRNHTRRSMLWRL